MAGSDRQGGAVQITLDTETTGIEPLKGDRILEIGCVRLNGRSVSEDPSFCLQIYINPERDIPEEVTAIHGITNEKVANCPKFAEIADRFIEFIRGAELLIHNAAFDVGFLNMELKRCGKGRLEDYCAKVTDTLELAHKRFPGRHVSLDALCSLLDVDNSSRTFHGALLDAELLAEVYLAMTRGQGSIALSSVSGTEKLPDLPDVSKLPVIKASPEELAEHERILDIAEKKSKSTCNWRKERTVPAPEGGAAQA
jgi:DNA polymerase-3 subunit epsilon